MHLSSVTCRSLRHTTSEPAIKNGRCATAATSLRNMSSNSGKPFTPSGFSWRSPALYLSAASTAGARWLQSTTSRHNPSKALEPGNIDGGSDEEEAPDSPVRQLLGPSVASSSAQEQQHRCGSLRWELMVVLAAVSVFICYADRSNISTAIISMAYEYNWNTNQQGIILSAFFAGYICTQLLGGSLADKYGGKDVLAVGVTAWSLCTLLTPGAAALGLPALVAMRVAMGLGEGVAFPAIHSLIARSVPATYQSTAVGAITAASYAGTALAFGLAPSLIDNLGWPWVFYLFGASAVLWLPIWLPLQVAHPGTSTDSSGIGRGLLRRMELGQWSGQGGKRRTFSLPKGLDTINEDQEHQRLWAPGTPFSDGPEGPGGPTISARRAPSRLGQPSGISSTVPAPSAGASSTIIRQGELVGEQPVQEEEEEALSEAGTEWSDGLAAGYSKARTASQQPGTGFAALLQTREVWAICVAQYTGSWGFYGLLTWLPTFFKDYYHVEISQLAGFTLWPYVVQGGVGAVSGILADRLLARGWPVRRVRRSLQAIGMLGPATCMLLAVSPLTDGSPSAASAWVTVGLGLNALTLAGVSVSQLDIAPRHAGVVFAAGNTAATAAGLLAVPVTGWVLAGTGSWALVFAITSLHYAVGAAIFCWWVGGEVLPQDG